MKQGRDILTTVLVLIAWIAVVIAVMLVTAGVAKAEEADEHEEEFQICYAICKPGDIVNIRATPGTKARIEGFLEVGDRVHLDFKKRGDYVHAVGLSTESGEGWIHRGYLVDDEPEVMDAPARIVSNGRLAARKNVGGRRTRWLKAGATVNVLVWSEKWCLTDCGYVMSEYLALGEEADG